MSEWTEEKRRVQVLMAVDCLELGEVESAIRVLKADPTEIVVGPMLYV